MKKQLTLLLILSAFVFTAQAQVFQHGTSVVNVGIGFGSSLAGNARPALSASFEHGMWEVGGPGVISLGGYVGNTGYNAFGIKVNYTIIGARAAYHYNGFTDAPDLDVYGGAMLSYNISSVSGGGGFGAIASNSALGLSGFVGGRYMFSDAFGAFAEIGYGISTLNVGVSFKF